MRARPGTLESAERAETVQLLKERFTGTAANEMLEYLVGELA